MTSLFRHLHKTWAKEERPFDPETGVYARKYFLARLTEERERTHRTGNPFCLLIADIDRMARGLSEDREGKAYRRFYRNVLQSLAANSRKTDIKGWFDENEIGIILPGTKMAGGLRYKEKMLDRIRKGLKGLEECELAGHVRIFCFGDSQESESGSTPPDAGTGTGTPNSPENSRLHEALFSARNSSFKCAAKRALDIAGCVAGLAVASVPMLLIGLLIKLTSPGPVLFRQERVGFLGRKFVLLKFRTMFVNADPAIHKAYVSNLINGMNEDVNGGTRDEPFYKITHDPRITPVGRILRKFSLDELPQLFNVLKGEMSLVGPRPPIPYEVDEYRLWHTGRVFEVKPGLTGPWQVKGRSRTDFDEMVRLDLYYADNWSLWLDLKLIVQTIPALYSAKGAC